MKVSIQLFAILALFVVAAVVAQEEDERECVDGNPYTVYNDECTAKSDWEVKHETEDGQMKCRCLARNIQQCVVCSFVDDDGEDDAEE